MDSNQEGFSLIPRWIRWAISVLVVTFTLISLVFAGYAVGHLYKIDSVTLAAAISLLQIAIIAAGGWLFLHFSRARINPEMIRAETDRFFTQDFPEALSRNHYYFDSEDRLVYDLSVSKVFHDKGTTTAYYLIASKQFGSLTVFMQINVKIIEVLYFLEPMKNGRGSRCDKDVKSTIVGAESVGWKSHRYGVKAFHGPKGFCKFPNTEIVMIKYNLNEMFLFNSPIRVFMANDVAMMTRSFIEEAGYR